MILHRGFFMSTDHPKTHFERKSGSNRNGKVVIKMKKKVAGVLMSICMMASLAGCSSPIREKVTAQGLIENAFKDEETYDIAMSLAIDAQIDLSEQGMDGAMEFSAGIDADIKSNADYAYMDGKANIKIFGMPQSINMESYYDIKEGLVYNYDEEEDLWTVSESDGDDGILQFDGEIFKDAVLTEHKRGEDYIVTAEVSPDDLGNIMKEMEDAYDMGDASDLSMDVTMVFDEKTKQIKSMNADIDGIESDGMEINEFSLSFTFNQIGGEIDVSIPKKVEKAAVWEDEAEESKKDEEDMGNIEEDNQSQEMQVDDTFGSYDGHGFYAGFDADIFLNDGWVMDGEFDGIFVPCKNQNYPDADLYLYTKKTKATPEDIEEDGVWGYELRVTYCDDGLVLPDATFRGLTWGASKEDVLSTYGEPTRSYDIENGTMIVYELPDGTQLSFSMYDENEFGRIGLTEISVINYDFMQDE